MSNYIQDRFTIINEKGIHARAAAQIVKCAEQYDAEILVEKDGIGVPATSIMGLLLLAAVQGSQVRVSGSGAEASQAIQAIGDIINNAFGEDG